MENNIVPVLDLDALQKKANEYAQKGAEETLKEFYTGYNSPYKKAIEEHLKHKGVDNAIEIPDIIGHLNTAFSAEVDRIANNAVSKSFVPLVSKFLTRANSEIKLSDVLKEFIKSSRYEYDEDLKRRDFKIDYINDDETFVYLEISNSQVSYEVHFYLKSKKDEPQKVYEIYTLPVKKENGNSYSFGRHSSYSTQTMKLSMDGGATLELPFIPKILEDEFVAYISTLVMANTRVTFDTDEFYNELFPERNNCHCHDEDEY